MRLSDGATAGCIAASVRRPVDVGRSGRGVHRPRRALGIRLPLAHPQRSCCSSPQSSRSAAALRHRSRTPTTKGTTHEPPKEVPLRRPRRRGGNRHDRPTAGGGGAVLASRSVLQLQRRSAGEDPHQGRGAAGADLRDLLPRDVQLRHQHLRHAAGLGWPDRIGFGVRERSAQLRRVPTRRRRHPDRERRTRSRSGRPCRPPTRTPAHRCSATRSRSRRRSRSRSSAPVVVARWPVSTVTGRPATRCRMPIRGRAWPGRGRRRGTMSRRPGRVPGRRGRTSTARSRGRGRLRARRGCSGCGPHDR